MANDKGKTGRLAQVERLKSEGYTVEEIATKLQVTGRTISNDIRELKDKGFIKEARRELPQTQSGRDMLVEQSVKTLDTVRWLINEGRSLLDEIKRYMGIVNHTPCEYCGCKGKYTNAQDFMAASKIMDSLTNSLTLLAKVMGEITDSPVVNVLQMDADVALLLRSITRGDESIARQLGSVDRELEQLGEQIPLVAPHVRSLREKIAEIGTQPLGRYVHQELTGTSARRANRLPSFPSIREEAMLEGPETPGTIDGEYREVGE